MLTNASKYAIRAVLFLAINSSKERKYGAKYIGAAGRLPDISPARHAKQFSIPILIVHGKVDQRVPVGQSRNLVKALKAAGKVEGRDFVYLEQPKNTHNFPFEADEVEFLQAVRRALVPRGAVVSNIMSTYSNRLHHSMMRTYMEVFGEVHIVDIRNSGNVIVVGLPHQPKLTNEALALQSRKLSREQKFPHNLGRFVKYGHRRPGEKEKTAPVLLDKQKSGKP